VGHKAKFVIAPRNGRNVEVQTPVDTSKWQVRVMECDGNATIEPSDSGVCRVHYQVTAMQDHVRQIALAVLYNEEHIPGSPFNVTMVPRLVRVFGDHGHALGRFIYPTGIAIDTSHVYVTDSSCLQLFRRDTFEPELRVEQFEFPSGVNVDDSRVYVASSGGANIQVLSTDLQSLSRRDQISHPGLPLLPMGVAADETCLYVTDRRSNSVHVYEKSGAFLRTIGSHGWGDGKFQVISAIAVDSSRIYVTDVGTCRVQVFGKASGQFVFGFGSVGVRNGQFTEPLGVSVDDRFIYIVTGTNSRIQMFTKDGTFVAVLLGQMTPSATAIAFHGDTMFITCMDHRVRVFQF
jgi:DNA-binding beta-propeller fold protein YncE